MTNANNNDYNHPVIAANQVMERANTYAEAWDAKQAFWRKRVFLGLFALTISTVAVVGISKTTVKGEHTNLRPWIGFVTHTTLAVLAYTLSDAIWFRREGYVGREVTGKTRIEATEDLVQQQGDRKFNPYGPIRELTTTVVENNNPEVLPPAPLEENLAKSVSGSKVPVLLIGGTGVGKTTFLERIIYEAYQACPEAEIILFDGKPTNDRTIMGLKTQPGAYFSVAQHSEIPRFYGQMDKVGARMSDPSRSQKSRKMFVIVDELNNSIKKADKFKLEESAKDPKDRDRFDYSKGLQIGNDLIISQGREKNCVGIATTHDAGGEALGQSMAQRSNQGFVVLGSGESFDNVEMILSGTGAKLIQNPNTLKKLKEQYDTHRDLLMRGYFALTNVGGNWRLVRLPDWSAPLPTIWNSPNSSPNQSYPENPEDDFSLENPYDEQFQDDEEEFQDSTYANKGFHSFSTRIRISELDDDSAPYVPFTPITPPSTNNEGETAETAETLETSEIDEKLNRFLLQDGRPKLYQFIMKLHREGLGKTEVVGKLSLLEREEKEAKSGPRYQKYKELYDNVMKYAAEQGWELPVSNM